MHIIGVSGSLREESKTATALSIALQKLANRGEEVELVDLRELHLPFCNGSKSYPDYPDVAAFRKKISTADGIILATPEYHGSLSGVLKNALDLLDFDDINGKVCAVISVLGGDHSHNAVNALRTICRQLHAWVIPDQLIIPNAELTINADHLSEELDKRLDTMLETFSLSIQKLR